MKTKIFLLLIIILSAVLRIYDIETKNMWFDEIFSWKLSQSSFKDIIIQTSGDIHPPFYYMLLSIWTSVFSDSIFSMRMMSVLFGILSIVFIYRISGMIFESKTSVFFVLLLYAVSPVNIFYSQEVRMLNLNLFLCLGSVYFFLMSLKNNSGRYILLFILFSVLAVYTHYFALLIVFTEFIVLLLKIIFRKSSFKNLKKQFAGLIAVNILFIPWYPVFFRQVSKGQPWRTVLSFKDTGLNFLAYFKDVFLSAYFSFEPSYIQYLSVFISYIILAYLLYSLFKYISSGENMMNDFNYTVLFFYIPLAIALLISFRQSIVFSRYLSIIIPFFIITLLFFSDRLYKKKFTVVLFMFLFAVSSLGTYINYENKFKNNDYRKITAYLEENIISGDKIIPEPHFMGFGIEYYIKHSVTRLPGPETLGWDLKMQLDSIRNRPDISSFWLILDYSSLENENYYTAEKDLKDIGYEKKESRTFYIIPAKVSVSRYIKSGETIK
ncbi:MAG: glycosyltransferase family 39 protein [Bacteroidetes bacterium]|nr:glycosyltransferase family 39 protein [Bacteroidota bacterium]